MAISECTFGVTYEFAQDITISCQKTKVRATFFFAAAEPRSSLPGLVWTVVDCSLAHTLAGLVYEETVKQTAPTCARRNLMIFDGRSGFVGFRECGSGSSANVVIKVRTPRSLACFEDVKLTAQLALAT